MLNITTDHETLPIFSEHAETPVMQAITRFYIEGFGSKRFTVSVDDRLDVENGDIEEIEVWLTSIFECLIRNWANDIRQKKCNIKGDY